MATEEIELCEFELRLPVLGFPFLRIYVVIAPPLRHDPEDDVAFATRAAVTTFRVA